MDKLKKYLSDSYKIVKALYETKKASHLNIVLGNVSGDMDSVTCAMILGYYQTYKDGFYSEEEKGDLDPETLSEERLKKLYIPILNMGPDELRARPDILYHFEHTGVSKDDLVFTSDVDIEHYANEGKLQCFLVDHNYPDCTQEYLIPYVTGIYDHHHETPAPYNELRFKDIRFCGAAATLVIKAVLEDEALVEHLVDPHVALFFAAPILIDTVNFAEKHRGKKWDQVDEDVYKMVKEHAGDIIPDDYYKNLYHQKADEEINKQLGWHLLARKDYKNYKMGNGLKLGISTIFLDIQTCVKNFGGDKLHEEFDEIMKERGLDMYLILPSYKVDGENRRQIIIYTPKSELTEELHKMWDNIDEVEVEKLDVEGLSTIENCIVLQNHSTSYSRKKLEPFIRKQFDS